MQVTALLETLKASLKTGGIRYVQVAEALNLSESSVKRKFSQKDFNLTELDVICDLVGLQINTLVKAMEERQGYLQRLSESQEAEIANDTALLLVTVCVLNHWTYEEILDFYVFSETQLTKMLAALDKLQMIELQVNNRIRLLVATNFSWLPNGPIEQMFLNVIQRDFFATRFDTEDHNLIVLNGMLSQASNTEFQRKMHRLAREFDVLNQEDASLPIEQRNGFTAVIALRDWQLQGFAPYRGTKAAKAP